MSFVPSLLDFLSVYIWNKKENFLLSKRKKINFLQYIELFKSIESKPNINNRWNISYITDIVFYQLFEMCSVGWLLSLPYFIGAFLNKDMKNIPFTLLLIGVVGMKIYKTCLHPFFNFFRCSDKLKHEHVFIILPCCCSCYSF